MKNLADFSCCMETFTLNRGNLHSLIFSPYSNLSAKVKTKTQKLKQLESRLTKNLKHLTYRIMEKMVSESQMRFKKNWKEKV